jgi:hypothetical protein
MVTCSHIPRVVYIVREPWLTIVRNLHCILSLFVVLPLLGELCHDLLGISDPSHCSTGAA